MLIEILLMLLSFAIGGLTVSTYLWRGRAVNTETWMTEAIGFVIKSSEFEIAMTRLKDGKRLQTQFRKEE